MKPTGRCIQQCVTCGGVHGGGVVVVCVFTCYFTTYLPSISLGRPDWTTNRFNVSAGINMKVGGNERPCIGVSGMVTYMGIGDHGLR